MSKRWLWLLVAVVVLSLAAVDFSQARSSSRSYSRSYSSRSYSKSYSSYKKPKASTSVWGKRSGGGIFGGTFSSSSSKSKTTGSSSGYSKPSSTANAGSNSGYSKPASSSKNSAGYSKPGTKSAPKSSSSSSGYSKSKNKSNFKSSTYDRKTVEKMRKQKSAQSLKAYKQETSKFKKKPVVSSSNNYSSNPIYSRSRRYGNFDYDSHYNRRDNYYNRSGWSAPSYVYMGSPSFGMWDAMFWWMMLDNLGNRNYAATAYNHANDPGYQAWKKEAEELAKTNKDLQAKLNELDKEVAGMSGTRDPGYLPPGVPAEVALSAEALAAKKLDKPPFKLATASKSGNYYFFGEKLRQFATGLDVEILNTAGSMANLRLLLAKDVDAALVQSDAFTVFQNKFPKSDLISEQTELYPEAIQMLANRDSGIKSVKDIDPDENILYIGPEGSGTALTWEGLCLQDSRYRRIPVKNMGYEQALQQVVKNPKAVMMFVAGLNSTLLKQAEVIADRNGDLRLVAVDDWDFNDARDKAGNKIYTFMDIPSSVYPALQKGWFFSHSVETLAVRAVLVVRTEWVEKYGLDAMEALSFAVMEAQPLVVRRVEGHQ